MKLRIALALTAGLMIGGAWQASAQVTTTPAAPAAAPAAPPAAPARPPLDPDRPLVMPAVAELGDGPWDFASEKGKLHVEVVTKGLDHPWGMAFVPGGDILVTERPGRLRVIRKGKLDPVAISGLPPIYAAGIAGLKDVVLHPKFATNRLIYLTFTKADPADKANSTLAVLRARWDGGSALADVTEIFEANSWYGKTPLPPKCCGQGPAFGSYGGRMVFDGKGKIILALGDRNYGEKVQDPANHFGKMVRLNDDGSVPLDNPFVGKAGWLSEIWTLGHRNPTGLTVNPADGSIWSTEFGPRGGDEVNRIVKGGNYGWMDVTQGFHYDGTPAKGIKDVPGMTDAVTTFGPPSFNPGNLAFYQGKAIPGWKGNLLVTGMSRYVVRISFDASGKVAAQEKLLEDMKQRWRDVRVAPDGSVYLLTDESKGAVLRLTAGK